MSTKEFLFVVLAVIVGFIAYGYIGPLINKIIPSEK